MSKIDQLVIKIKDYFSLINSKSIITWNRGYYWSKNKELQNKEKLFLKSVPKLEKEIISAIQENPLSKKVIYFASLLGWGRNIRKNSKILFYLLNVSSHKIHNYAARALFPLIIKKKVKINIENLILLSCHNNPYCKNKAMGIMAFMPLTVVEIKKLENELSMFKKLSNHRKEIVNRSAKLLLQRLKTEHQNKI